MTHFQAKKVRCNIFNMFKTSHITDVVDSKLLDLSIMESPKNLLNKEWFSSTKMHNPP